MSEIISGRAKEISVKDKLYKFLKTKPEFIICKKCYSKNKYESKFCKNCGKDLKKDRVKALRSFKIRKIILLIIPVLLLSPFIYLFINKLLFNHNINNLNKLIENNSEILSYQEILLNSMSPETYSNKHHFNHNSLYYIKNRPPEYYQEIGYLKMAVINNKLIYSYFLKDKKDKFNKICFNGKITDYGEDCEIYEYFLGDSLENSLIVLKDLKTENLYALLGDRKIDIENYRRGGGSFFSDLKYCIKTKDFLYNGKYRRLDNKHYDFFYYYNFQKDKIKFVECESKTTNQLNDYIDFNKNGDMFLLGTKIYKNGEFFENLNSEDGRIIISKHLNFKFSNNGKYFAHKFEGEKTLYLNNRPFTDKYDIVNFDVTDNNDVYFSNRYKIFKAGVYRNNTKLRNIDCFTEISHDEKWFNYLDYFCIPFIYESSNWILNGSPGRAFIFDNTDKTVIRRPYRNTDKNIYTIDGKIVSVSGGKKLPVENQMLLTSNEHGIYYDYAEESYGINGIYKTKDEAAVNSDGTKFAHILKILQEPNYTKSYTGNKKGLMDWLYLKVMGFIANLNLKKDKLHVGYALCINFTPRLFYDEIIGVVYCPEEKCFASLARRDKDIYLVKYLTKDMRE